MKEYFSHDYHARHDEKIIRLLQKEGWVGYGLYWAMIEKLYEADGFLKDDYESISYDLRTEYERIKSLVEDYKLFQKKDGRIFSESVLYRLRLRKGKSEKARQSVNYRWAKRKNDDTNVLRTEYDGNTIKEKKRKLKYTAANAEQSEDMGYEEFNDGDITYEDDTPSKGAKRDKGRKKIYGTFVMHYMKITNKKGNVLQFFPAARDIYELCVQEFPNYGNEQILAEITRRIDMAHEHYTRLEMKDWGLMKLVANWSNVLGWKVKDAPQEADVSARRKL